MSLKAEINALEKKAESLVEKLHEILPRVKPEALAEVEAHLARALEEARANVREASTRKLVRGVKSVFNIFGILG